MKTFQSYSQAGQDRFVRALLPQLNDGTFLEIGSNHPVERNNTYALEQLGWRGLLVDNDEVCVRLCQAQRVSPVVQGDATKLAWSHVLAQHAMPKDIDYLSLDVDAATLGALQALPLPEYAFNVITIEHDAYRFGPGPRDAMRGILGKAGYLLVAGDVKDQGMAFEDWWVSAELGPAMGGKIPAPVDAFWRRHDCEWQELFNPSNRSPRIAPMNTDTLRQPS